MPKNVYFKWINENLHGYCGNIGAIHDNTIISTVRALKQSEEKVISLMLKETGYLSSDINILLKATYDFLNRVGELKKIALTALAKENDLYAKIEKNSCIYYQPWGRILVCIPSNAPLPLSAIVPIALLMSGNTVILASSSKVQGTVGLIGAILTKHFPKRIIVWPYRVRDAIESLVAKFHEIDAVYFMGSSSHYSQIAYECASVGTKLIYEGEGRGVAIIGNDLNKSELLEAVRNIVKSKTFCYGQMCSAPNVVAVNSKYKDEFINAYIETCNKGEFSKEIMSLCKSKAKESAWQVVSGAPMIPKLEKGRKETPLLVLVPNISKAVEQELFSPVCFLYEYNKIDSLIEELDKNRFYLQISAFTKNKNTIKKIIRLTHYARYCLNTCPSEQNPLLPWGNYGCSGDSAVLDFYRKGLRRILVEGRIHDLNRLISYEERL